MTLCKSAFEIKNRLTLRLLSHAPLGGQMQLPATARPLENLSEKYKVDWQLWLSGGSLCQQLG
jgi:hypothetical protein